MIYISMVYLTAYCMTSLFLHDACVACLCGSHTYPLISNSVVSVELVSLDLVFDMRLIALFTQSLTELVIRSRV